MSHGYLIAQFFSPRSNRRADAYGAAPAGGCGSPRRCSPRCATAPGRSSRSACGSPPTSWRPRGSTARRAPRSRASCARPGLVDFASFVLGHSAYVAASSWIAPPPPAPEAAIAGPLAAVRAAVDVPVIGTTRVVDVAAAERLVESGAADAVGMTRALIADPDLVGQGGARAGPATCSPASAATRAASGTTTPACRSAASSTRAPAASARCRAARAATGALRVARRRRRAGGRRRGGRGGGARRRRHAARPRRRHRRPAAPGRPRARPPRALAPLARERGARARARRRRRCGWARRPDADELAAPTSSCSPPARGRSCPTGRRADAPATRSSATASAARLLDAWTAIANPAAVAGPGARRRLGRRLGRPRRRRGARRAGARGHARLRGAVPRRHAAPVPAQPLPRALRRARHRDPAPHRGHRATGCATCSRAAERRSRRVATIVYAQGREPDDELWAALEGAPGPRPRRRRARPAHRRGGDARGRHRAPGARAATLRRRPCTRARQTTASSPSRCATPAASVRERTSSLARIRETWTLAVFSAM